MIARLLCLQLLLFFLPGCQVLEKIRGKDERQPSAKVDRGAEQVFFTTPDDGPTRPGNIAECVAGYIDQADETLDVCAFELDNRVIVDAFLRAVRRGVKVRVVTETDYIDEIGITELKKVNVPIVDDQRNGSLMHNKFIVFDRRAVWTGSMNFTENCAYKNNNHGLYLPSKDLAENYTTKFEWMFRDHKFGGAPAKDSVIPHPRVTLGDGTPVENYFSTHDHPAKHVEERIRLAKKSIHFMAFSFTHDDIGEAMLDAHKAGLDVSGVFETTQASNQYCEYQKLKDAGAKVFLDGNSRNMHHKVIILDGEIVICGSFNLSASADDSNDENLLIIRNKTVAEKFEAEFQRVLKKANP